MMQFNPYPQNQYQIPNFQPYVETQLHNPFPPIQYSPFQFTDQFNNPIMPPPYPDSHQHIYNHGYQLPPYPDPHQQQYDPPYQLPTRAFDYQNSMVNQVPNYLASYTENAYNEEGSHTENLLQEFDLKGPEKSGALLDETFARQRERMDQLMGEISKSLEILIRNRSERREREDGDNLLVGKVLDKMPSREKLVSKEEILVSKVFDEVTDTGKLDECSFKQGPFNLLDEIRMRNSEEFLEGAHVEDSNIFNGTPELEGTGAQMIGGSLEEPEKALMNFEIYATLRCSGKVNVDKKEVNGCEVLDEASSKEKGDGYTEMTETMSLEDNYKLISKMLTEKFQEKHISQSMSRTIGPIVIAGLEFSSNTVHLEQYKIASEVKSSEVKAKSLKRLAGHKSNIIFDKTLAKHVAKHSPGGRKINPVLEVVNAEIGDSRLVDELLDKSKEEGFDTSSNCTNMTKKETLSVNFEKGSKSRLNAQVESKVLERTIDPDEVVFTEMKVLIGVEAAVSLKLQSNHEETTGLVGIPGIFAFKTVYIDTAAELHKIKFSQVCPNNEKDIHFNNLPLLESEMESSALKSEVPLEVSKGNQGPLRYEYLDCIVKTAENMNLQIKLEFSEGCENNETQILIGTAGFGIVLRITSPLEAHTNSILQDFEASENYFYSRYFAKFEAEVEPNEFEDAVYSRESDYSHTKQLNCLGMLDGDLELISFQKCIGISSRLSSREGIGISKKIYMEHASLIFPKRINRSIRGVHQSVRIKALVVSFEISGESKGTSKRVEKRSDSKAAKAEFQVGDSGRKSIEILCLVITVLVDAYGDLNDSNKSLKIVAISDIEIVANFLEMCLLLAPDIGCDCLGAIKAIDNVVKIINGIINILTIKLQNKVFKPLPGSCIKQADSTTIGGLKDGVSTSTERVLLLHSLVNEFAETLMSFSYYKYLFDGIIFHFGGAEATKFVAPEKKQELNHWKTFVATFLGIPTSHVSDFAETKDRPEILYFGIKLCDDGKTNGRTFERSVAAKLVEFSCKDALKSFFGTVNANQAEIQTTNHQKLALCKRIGFLLLLPMSYFKVWHRWKIRLHQFWAWRNDQGKFYVTLRAR